MASLLVAGTILISEKIKGKNKNRREKKRQAYEDRYSELEQEHQRSQQNYMREQNTGTSQSSVRGGERVGDLNAQAMSSTDDKLSMDGPAQWVEEAHKDKHKS